MNKDCAIARDLMPQIIDGIASEESKAFVETHMEDCDSCTQVYADMQGEIQAMEATKATTSELSFKDAIVQLRKTMGWKRLKTTVLAVVLTVVFGYGGCYYLCEYSAYQDVRAMPSYAYEINLFQGNGAAVHGLVTLTDNYCGSNGSLIIRNDENDDTVLYIYWTAPIILLKKYGAPNSNHAFIVNMTMTENGGLTRNGDTIREIRQGKPDNYRVVYLSGDTIPPIDPDLAAHYYIQDSDFDQMDEAQQMREDAEQMNIDAQIEFSDSLDQPENTEAVTPTVSPAE